MQLETRMSTSNIMIAPSSRDDVSDPKFEGPALDSARQPSSRDVQEASVTQRCGELNSHAAMDSINLHASLAAVDADADVAATLSFMKAKILDLESKLSQMQEQVFIPAKSASAPLSKGNGSHSDKVTAKSPELALEKAEVKRKHAAPLLNRVSWVPFKNVYPDEAVFAIDVLMVPKPFSQYCQAHHRTMLTLSRSNRGSTGSVVQMIKR